MADLFVVEFKGHRKEFFFNTYYHKLSVKDHVVIQAERGEDVGVIKQQIRKEAGYDAGTKPKSILRRASGEDLTRLGLAPGPVFREILQALEDAQLDGRLTSREQALAFVRSRYRTTAG